MLLNFLGGNAAANVFARSVGAALRVVDAGVAGPPVDHPDLLSRRLGEGTANSLAEPAMSGETCARALAIGRELGRDGDWDAAAFGEMGIANTSAAALLAHKTAGLPLDAARRPRHRPRRPRPRAASARSSPAPPPAPRSTSPPPTPSPSTPASRWR